MRKLIIFTCLFFVTSFAKAQISNLSDLNGAPLRTTKYTDIVGSPFYNDYWIIGNVLAFNGKSFNGISLKYDTFKDVIYFKQKINDDLFEFVDQIKSFTLITPNGNELFSSGFPEVEKFNKQSYYQVLGENNGNYLLKKQFKSIQETKAFNSATTEKTFTEVVVYYLLKDGKMIRFKPSKKEFLNYFPNQTEKINTYLKANDVDFKNSTDLGNLFSHVTGTN